MDDINIVCDPERLIKNCRVCDSDKLELAIDLGFQPWGNNFLKKEEVGAEPFYPLRVVFCMDCRTPQLDYTVPKETMFAEHTYLSGVTKTLSDHFKAVAEEVNFSPNNSPIRFSGNNNSTKNSGRLISKTHLPTCFVN